MDEYNLLLIPVQRVEEGIVGRNAIIGRRSRKIYVLLGAIMLLTALSSVTRREVRADSQNQVDR